MTESRFASPRSPKSRVPALLGVALLLLVGASSVEAQSSGRENGVSRARAARAERAKSGVGASAGTRVTSASASGTLASATVSTPPVDATPRFDGVMRAMADAPALGNQFVRIRLLRADQIQLVDIRNVFRERSEQERFESAVAQHDRAITALRSTLQNSITLRDLLYDRQLAMSQVVAVDVLPEGKGAIVYYRSDKQGE